MKHNVYGLSSTCSNIVCTFQASPNTADAMEIASASVVLLATLVRFFDDHHNGKPNSVDPTVIALGHQR